MNKLQPVLSDKCGTTAGYARHALKNEYPCEPCRLAKYEYTKKWRNENKQKHLAHKKNYRIKNGQRPEGSYKKLNLDPKNYVQQYMQLPHVKEKFAEQSRKRRALKRNSKYEKYTLEQVLELYGTKCHLCNEMIDLNASRWAGHGKDWKNGLHIDHVIPLSKGGSDSIDNVRPAHGLCNLKKRNKL